MKLSHLYTNQPAIFTPIRFREGLNVVLARVQHPKDQQKVSHNLGKSLLIDVLDFGLLKGIDKHHFFKKRADLFASFVFFLEIRLHTGGYVTVRRSADEATKIAFKRHSAPYQDFTSLPENEWDHWRVTFERAVEFLDSMLALTSIKPWSFRKGVSYFLRSQADYRNVFQLSKFVGGKDRDWKPYVAGVFGFDDALPSRKYAADAEIQRIDADRAELQAEVNLKPADYEKLKASIAVKRDEVGAKVSALDRFDFHRQEVGLAQQLAESVEAEIAATNDLLYNARHDLALIERGLQDEIHFDLAEVQRVFRESQLTFPEQLARDYSELVEFNRRILTERRAHLLDRAAALRTEVASLEQTNATLSGKRRDILSVLGGTDSLRKFKDLQRQLDQDRASLVLMETKSAKLERVIALRDELRRAKAKAEALAEDIQAMLRQGTPRYQEIPLIFSRIVKEIIHRSAILYCDQNGEGNLEFHAEYTDLDTDAPTEEHRGTSFLQILCIAFDLAVLSSYAQEPFFHFVYHDGGLERLESKRKLALLQVVRDVCSRHQIQYLLSALNEDLPASEEASHLIPRQEEIILELHDGGESGRLFKMATF